MVMMPTIEVASLGMWDSLILMVMALVVFGPRRLPEFGRQIGKLMYEVRKASNDFKFQMEDELRKAEEADRRKRDEALALAAPASPVVDSQVVDAGAGSPALVDSRISEARVGVPESPYPGESVYPAVSPGEFHHEEPYPQIHPPSTGEPVQAERPGRMMEQGVEAVPAAVAEEAVPAAKRKRSAGTRAKKAGKEPEITNG
jgi:sec-independent protein translocase protein TatB